MTLSQWLHSQINVSQRDPLRQSLKSQAWRSDSFHSNPGLATYLLYDRANC